MVLLWSMCHHSVCNTHNNTTAKFKTSCYPLSCYLEVFLKFKKEQILAMCKQCAKGTKLDDWNEREMHISEFNGYGQDCYHATFFAVNGSPLRVVGFIATYGRGFQMVVSAWRLGTGKGDSKSYFFTTAGERVAKNKIM